MSTNKQYLGKVWNRSNFQHCIYCNFRLVVELRYLTNIRFSLLKVEIRHWLVVVLRYLSNIRFSSPESRNTTLAGSRMHIWHMYVYHRLKIEIRHCGLIVEVRYLICTFFIGYKLVYVLRSWHIVARRYFFYILSKLFTNVCYTHDSSDLFDNQPISLPDY